MMSAPRSRVMVSAVICSVPAFTSLPTRSKRL